MLDKRLQDIALRNEKDYDPREQMDRVLRETVLMNRDIETAVATLRGLQREAARRKRVQEKADDEEFEAWSREATAEATATLSRVAPELQGMEHTVVALPNGLNTTMVEQSASNSAVEASAILSVLEEHPHDPSNLKNCVDHYWEHIHRLLTGEDQVADGDDGAEEDSRCFKAGVCLCCEWGRTVYMFRNRFYAMCKIVFAKGKAHRTLFTERKMWVRTTCTGSTAAEEQQLLDMGVDGGIYQISRVCLCPYELMFQECLPTTPDERLRATAEGNEMVVKAGGVWEDEYDMFYRSFIGGEIRCDWYTIALHDRPIIRNNMLPGLLVLEPMPDLGMYTVWPKPPRRRALGRGRGRGKGDGRGRGVARGRGLARGRAGGRKGGGKGRGVAAPLGDAAPADAPDGDGDHGPDDGGGDAGDAPDGDAPSEEAEDDEDEESEGKPEDDDDDIPP